MTKFVGEGEIRKGEREKRREGEGERGRRGEKEKEKEKEKGRENNDSNVFFSNFQKNYFIISIKEQNHVN